jgi:multicomponent Na+:H+ antiporter subunit F
MILIHEIAAGLLLLTLLVGLIRVWRGPTPADRMLAAQLFGTTGVATLLILAESQAQPSLRDVALVLVTLASLGTVGFVSRAWTGSTAAGSGSPAEQAAGSKGDRS